MWRFLWTVANRATGILAVTRYEIHAQVLSLADWPVFHVEVVYGEVFGVACG